MAAVGGAAAAAAGAPGGNAAAPGGGGGGASAGDQYARHSEMCQKFLLDFQTEDPATGEPVFKYAEALQRIANREVDVLEVSLDDLHHFTPPEFFDRVIANTTRYLKLLAEAADLVMPESQHEFDDSRASVLDIFLHHRMLNYHTDGARGDGATSAFPKDLTRRFEVTLTPSSKAKTVAIRHVKAAQIGRLVTVRGIVTRVTEVKPMVQVATYTCEVCSGENYQVVKGAVFTPMMQCRSTECERNRSGGMLYMQTRGSKFVKFQEVRIQEMADQVPVGHIPRTMAIHVTGHLTRTCNPGETVTVTGIFLPTPYAGSGARSLKQGLLSDTYLLAQHMEKQKKSYAESFVSDEARERIAAYARDGQIYDKLASSVAPEIFGHEDAKKALLLLLIGGLDRTLADGMKIRGDINVCLMGDPGVAKSQLLKFVCNTAPRGVYTTGKGSSGVGLTAAITKDTLTGEMVLEGGALVLADKGVCCIDEFDKMDENDRTSIHEVMEQQTISVAKAGITTTLNARSSILAAANPQHGRYDPRNSMESNINLPAALLSRFDLVFLMLDRPSREDDLRLAQHITYVHQHNQHPDLEWEPLDAAFIRQYISVARTYRPFIPETLTAYIVHAYVAMREKARDEGRRAIQFTPRTLLAILRLSTALARLRFSEQVEQGDVNEAMRLMTVATAAHKEQQGHGGMGAAGGDGAGGRRETKDRVYHIVVDLINKAKDNKVSLADTQARLLAQGYTANDWDDMIAEYTSIDVLGITKDKRFLFAV